MPNTDPINIPIKATDTATADMKKVASAADKLGKTGVNLDVKAAGAGPGGILGKLQGFIGGISGAAVAGGAAIGTLGKIVGDSISNWQSLALEVGHFRDSTGTSADEASRFVELAKDMGLSVDTVQTMIGKLNKTAGSTPGVLKDLGIQIRYAKDGTTDTEGTFLAAVDAISAMKDPAEQAAAASKLFGKNWQAAAEIITGGAGPLKQRLDSLSGTKLVDDGEIERAKKVRDQLDAMHDSIDELSNIVGEKLAPALGDAAESLSKLGKVGGPVLAALIDGASLQTKTWTYLATGITNTVGDIGGAVGSLTGLWGDHKAASDAAAGGMDVLTGAEQAAAIAADGAGVSFHETTAKIDGMHDAALSARDAFDRMEAALDMKKAADDLVAKIGGAMLTVGSGAQVTSDDVYNIQKSILEVGKTADANPITLQSSIDAISRGDWNAAYAVAKGFADNASPVSIEVQLRLKAAQDLRALISGGGGRGNVPGSYSAVPSSSSAGPAVAPMVAPIAVAVPVAAAAPASIRVVVNAGMIADSATLARAITRGERSASRLMGSRWREVARA